MSQLTREWVCDRLVFQRESQRFDLLDENLTNTDLIAFLQGLLQVGEGRWAQKIEITSVRTDHSDDLCLGTLGHTGGHAVDCWPLASKTAGDYLDAADPLMQQFLRDAASTIDEYQIGLGGSAQTPANYDAAGPTVFTDNGADHIHLGAR